MPIIAITIQITVDDVNQAADNFLELYPVPLNEDESPQFTKLAWFKKVVGDNIARDIERGRVSKARNAISFNPDFAGVVTT